MFDSGAVQVPDGNPASDTLFLQVVTQPVRTKSVLVFVLRVVLCFTGAD